MELVNTEARLCGNCTHCCDGTLSANVRGHEMSPGIPCFFVQLNKGCKDYENRPDDPCKEYMCEWLAETFIPIEWKPDKVGWLITSVQGEKFKYLKLMPSGNFPTEEHLNWFKEYLYSNNLNGAWHTKDRLFWQGSDEFEDEMIKESHRSMGYN